MSLRHERRRRLHTDEAATDQTPPSVSLAVNGTELTVDGAQLYADAARESLCRPVHTLLPLSPVSITLYLVHVWPAWEFVWDSTSRQHP